MSLLKDDGTAPGKMNSRKVIIVEWPDERLPNGLGLSIKDGWYFGVGFGLAMTIAVPFVLFLFGLFLLVIFAIFGNLGNLWL